MNRIMRGAAVAAAAGLLLAACGTSSPAGSPSAGQTTVSQTPAGVPSEAPWTVVGGGPLPVDQLYPTDVAVRGDTVVAAGVTVSSAETPAPMASIWASTAGSPWEAAVMEGAGSGWPQALTATSDGFIAVGWLDCASPWAYADPGECTTAIWRSPDGISWSLLEEPRITSATLTGIVAWDDGYLAVGTRGSYEQDNLAGLLVRSGDGASWKESDLGTDPTGLLFTNIATDGEQLAAVGLYPISQGAAIPAFALTSTDAQHWASSPLASDWQPFSVSVAPTSTGFVATGMAVGVWGTGSHVIAWRVDGDDWVSLALSEGWETRVLTDVAAGPAGALIVGADSDSAGALLYGSQDGTAWMATPLSGELTSTPIQPTAAIWHEDRFYLIGISETNGTRAFVLSGMPHLPTPAEVEAGAPEPTPTPEPVSLTAEGQAGIDLQGVADYTPHPDGPATCTSLLGGTQLGDLAFRNAGELRGGAVLGALLLDPGAAVGDSVTLEVMVDQAVPEEIPEWRGNATIADLAPDATSGSVTLQNLPLLPSPLTDAPLPGWPALLSGSLSWECKPWLDPNATPPPPAGGLLSVNLDTSGWEQGMADVTCEYEAGGSVLVVSGQVGSLRDQMMVLDISLSGDHRLGGATAAFLRAVMPTGPKQDIEYLPGWEGTVTFTDLAADETSGAGTIDLQYMPSSNDGWPTTLTGTVHWECGG